MGYTKRLVCLANSYKHGGVCIAGRELTQQGYGPWIRPVSARNTQELFLAECHCPGIGIPRLPDIIEIPLQVAAPQRHQFENHLIDPTTTWAKLGELSFAELETLCQNPPLLWTNTDHTASGVHDCISAADASAHTVSLFLIKVRSLVVETRSGHFTPKKQIRCKFRHCGTDYNLSLTDQLARDRFESQRPGEYSMIGNPALYLTISLTEPFREDGRCHKLVAALFANPTVQA